MASLSKRVSESSDGNQGPIVVRQGWLTKQGRVRKTWRRRLFILQSDGCLTYYKSSDLTQTPAGTIALSDCTLVRAGGECAVRWPATAAACSAIGIMTRSRRLYVHADNGEELAAWLSVIREAVPKGVPVCTPEDVTTSFGHGEGGGESGPPPLRVTVFLNASTSRTGRVILLPATMEKLLEAAGAAYSVEGIRIYDCNGSSIDDVTAVRDDDIIYLSQGEPFAFAEGLVRSATIHSAGESSSSEEDEGDAPAGPGDGGYLRPEPAAAGQAVEAPEYLVPGPGNSGSVTAAVTQGGDSDYAAPSTAAASSVDADYAVPSEIRKS